jgi:CRISPR system Cascade subunit CasE
MISLFLTQAELRPASRNLAKIISQQSNQDAGHSLIWSLFEHADGAKTPPRFLWRVLEKGKRFLLLSNLEPKSVPDGLWALVTKPMVPSFKAGQQLRFQLRANPAVTLPRGQGLGNAGKHVDAIMHARFKADRSRWSVEDTEKAALGWLFARELRLGLVFDREATMAMGYMQVNAGRPSVGNEVRFSTVDYQGVATVSDPIALANAIANGVGKARRYGCGLLLVRPA